MIPTLNGIDHVHVYVRDRAGAARWYEDTLGFRAVDGLEIWSDDPRGPLTVEDRQGTLHIALFESDRPPTSTVAFRTTAEGFLAWKAHLENRGLALRVSDHTLAFSLYFDDPYGNNHEITTSEHDQVRARLTA